MFLDEFAPGFDVVAHHVALAKSVTTFMSRGAKVYVSNDNLCVSHQSTQSESKTTHEVEYALLDEFTARFEVVAHQDSKGKIENPFGEFRIQPLCLVGPAFVSQDPTFMSPTKSMRSDIEIGDVEGVFFYEFAAGFDVVAHQDAEDFVGGGGIVHADLQE